MCRGAYATAADSQRCRTRWSLRRGGSRSSCWRVRWGVHAVTITPGQEPVLVIIATVIRVVDGAPGPVIARGAGYSRGAAAIDFAVVEEVGAAVEAGRVHAARGRIVGSLGAVV